MIARNTSAAMESDLESGLHRVRLSFLEHLDERLDQMEVHCDLLADPHTRDQALKVIQSIAHKIAGTAETVGFADLGRHAITLDLDIATYEEAPSADGYEDLLLLIDALIETGSDILRVHFEQNAGR